MKHVMEVVYQISFSLQCATGYKIFISEPHVTTVVQNQIFLSWLYRVAFLHWTLRAHVHIKRTVHVHAFPSVWVWTFEFLILFITSRATFILFPAHFLCKAANWIIHVHLHCTVLHSQQTGLSLRQQNPFRISVPLSTAGWENFDFRSKHWLCRN